jgi:membrane-associated phospholipid phosphatase
MGIAYALSMAFALVYLGEHYIIDELAGLVAATVAWRLVSRGLRLPRLFTVERRVAAGPGREARRT